ncbi:hypothetical protein EDB29_101622 [Vibrio crassostreae]|nr:hypothetical protein EDB29_101622 [Vibrio crassostreae]
MELVIIEIASYHTFLLTSIINCVKLTPLVQDERSLLITR